MGAPSLNSRSLRVAIAAVFALFSFLVAFFVVADRLGMWVAVGGAAIVFVIVLAISPQFIGNQSENRPPGNNHLAPTTIVQTPVKVNVPVSVRVERERDTAPTREMPISAKQEESPPAVIPPPPALAPMPFATSDEVFDSVPLEETLFEDVVVVGIGREGCWKYELPLDIGDTLEAEIHVVENEDINWSIMSKKKLFAWLDGADAEYVAGEENVRARDIKWTARKGNWYFVLDAFLKHYPRKVSVRLRVVRRP